MNKTIFSFALSSLMLLYTNAQVGINMIAPDTCASLEISSVDGRKGLVIPQFLDAHLTGFTVSKDNGLMVYARNQQRFLFRNGTQWNAINPFASNAAFDPILPTNRLLRIGANTISLGADSRIAIEGDVTLNSTTTNPNQFIGFGTVPLGGIIMWNGTTVPNGWALCNGQTVNGRTTPDLRGRFIVGYGADNVAHAPGVAVPADVWDANYTNINGTGGEREHGLSRSEIPKHEHYVGDGQDNSSMSDRTFVTGIDHYDKPDINGNGTTDENPVTNVYLTSDSHHHYGRTGDGTSSSYTITILGIPITRDLKGGLTENAAGRANAHENRPPYYVLAFIMRVY